MALPDLLWACPACGEDRGLDDDGVCAACDTRFARGRGSTIVATAPDGTTTVRSARKWLDRLPDPASLVGCGGAGDAGPTGDAGDVGDAGGKAAPEAVVRSAAAAVRPVTAEQAVFGETGYLNRVEVFGDPVPGRLTLTCDALRVAREGEGEEVWPLEALTAVQASSSSLQLKRRGAPLVAFRFENDSVYLWEQLLHAALRDFYGRTGRGEILEFQPRIVAR